MSTQNTTALKQARRRKIRSTRIQIQEMYRETQVKNVLSFIYELGFFGFCEDRDRKFQERIESEFLFLEQLYIFFFFADIA